MNISDNGAQMDFNGRCGDGIDDTIVSYRLYEAAVLKGIGRIQKEHL